VFTEEINFEKGRAAMRFVGPLCLLSASLLTAVQTPTASAHDKPKPPPVCGTPTPTGPVNPGPFPPFPNPGPFPPLPVPTGPVVRDHRTPVVVRDHRDQSGPIVRDHRTNTGPIIRDHRTVKGKPIYTPDYTVPPRPPVVTNPSSVDASQASGGVVVTQSKPRTVVRDHRRPARKSGGTSIDLPGPLPNIPLPKLPVGIPTPF
jgi:hypothetical protein